MVGASELTKWDVFPSWCFSGVLDPAGGDGTAAVPRRLDTTLQRLANTESVDGWFAGKMSCFGN